MNRTEPVDPVELKVNPRKWTTKVNFAVVAAVVVVLLIGAGYAFFAVGDSREVHEEIHQDMTPSTSAP